MHFSEEVKNIFAVARGEKRSYILEHEVKQILQTFGLNVTREYLCNTVQKAIEAAQAIGYPVVLKIVSAQVVHKSDIGGVKVGIQNERELRASYQEMTLAFYERFEKEALLGILVQEMASGQEMILGAVRDSQFGLLMMVGIGGVFVELYRDVAYRLPPVTEEEALTMLKELKGLKMLDGYRGLPRINIPALCRTIRDFSKALVELPEIREMDLNPVLVNENGAVVADARLFI